MQKISRHCPDKQIDTTVALIYNMVRVAFYAVPHVMSRQLIEYICKQREINLHSKQLAKVKAIILENIDSTISKATNLSNDFFNTLANCSNIYDVYVFIETKLIDDNVVSDEHGQRQMQCNE